MIYNRGDRVMVQFPGVPEYVGTVQQGSSDETSHMGRPFRWVTVSRSGFDSVPGYVVSDRFLRRV